MPLALFFGLGPSPRSAACDLFFDEEKQFPFIDVIPRHVFAACCESYLLINNYTRPISCLISKEFRKGWFGKS